eukprot:gene3153-3946_t
MNNNNNNNYTNKKPIDHTFFDPRGIRDYSQVKKPTGTGMPGNNSKRDDEDDFDTQFVVIVKNLPSTVITSDLAYMFSFMETLRDFELNTDTRQASIIFGKRSDALAAIERYNNVELDGNKLFLYEDSAEIPQLPPSSADTEQQQEDKAKGEEIMMTDS